MRIKDIRISVKLLVPALISGLIMLAIGYFGASRLSSFSAEANNMISRRDKAALDSARANRATMQAEAYAYASLVNDVSDTMTKAFNEASDQSVALFTEASSLLPEEAASFDDFVRRFNALKPKLQKAFDIGNATPGLNHSAALKPSDLESLGVGASILNEVAVGLNKIVSDAAALNARLLAENTARAGQMRADAASLFWQILTAGLVGALAASALTFKLSSAFVTGPLQSIAEAMRKLAAGDVAVEIPGGDRRDEVGAMAAAVVVFKESAVEKLRLEAAGADARRVAEAERAKSEADRAERVRLQAQVVSGLAEGLDRLQAGKLTHRLEDAWTPEYERLRADFNGAIGKLQQTLGVVASNATAIRSGTREISTAADELSRRTEQQAANLEETSAAINQIAETVRKTSSGVNHARDLVLEAQSEARSSGEVVQHAIGAMSDISASSNKISSIIAVIDEIAFQTNLLALNAGVEAARAGDAGKGFAVVASEVRALAQRSAEASKEIRSLIHDSAGRVDAGVELVAQTGTALTKIQSSIVKINEIIQDIAHSASEQASSLDEVSTAVRQMDLVTQQNAAMVEESTAATRRLADESDELARLIDEFEVDARPAAGRASARGDVPRLANVRPAYAMQAAG